MKVRTPALMLAIAIPLFNKERGGRLALARMGMGLDQARLAERLSTPECRIVQSHIARLEGGRVDYAHFTIRHFIEKFGINRVEYVLLNMHADTYSRDRKKILTAYWHDRLKAKPGQKKRGNPHRHLHPQVEAPDEIIIPFKPPSFGSRPK